MQHDMGNDFECDDAKGCHGRGEHEEGAALFQGGHYFQMGGNLFLDSQFSCMPNGIQISQSHRGG